MKLITEFLRETVASALAFALLSVALLVGLTAPAVAGEIDFTSLLSNGVDVLAAVLTVLAAWISRWIVTRLKLGADSEVRTYLDEALFAGIALATARARERLAGKPVTIEVKNEIVAGAANYAMAKVPDALKRFGITPQSLAEMVEARLPDLSAPAVAASPEAEPAG